MRRWTPVLAIALALIIVTGSYTARAGAVAIAALFVVGTVVSSFVAGWLAKSLMDMTKPVSGTGYELIDAVSVRDFNAFAVYHANMMNNLQLVNMTYTFYARMAESLVDQHAGEGGEFNEEWIEPVLDSLTNMTWHMLRDYATLIRYTAVDIKNLDAYASSEGINFYAYECRAGSPTDKRVLVFEKRRVDRAYNVNGDVIQIRRDSNVTIDIVAGDHSLLVKRNVREAIRNVDFNPDVRLVFHRSGGTQNVTPNYIGLVAPNACPPEGRVHHIALYDVPRRAVATARFIYAQVKRIAEIRWEIVKDNADAVKTPPPSVLFWDPKQLEKLSPTERMYAYYAWLRALANWNWSETSEMTPSRVPAVNLTGGIELGDGSVWYPLYVPDTCTLRKGSWTAPFDIPSMVVYPNGTYRYVIVRNGTTLNITSLPGNATELTLSPTTLEDWAELQGVLVEPEEPEVEEKDIDWTKIALYLGGALLFLLIGIPVLSGIGERLESTVAGIRPGTRPRGGRRGGPRRGRGGRRR